MKRLVGIMAFASFAAQAAPAAKPDIDRDMTAILTSSAGQPLQGLAAIRLHDGQESYRFFGGFRHRQAGRAWPVQPDTLFRVASVSKVVTTIGLMQLVEQGKVDLDRDVSDYLGFRLRNPAFPDEPIRVRMLLNHTSSLRDAEGYTLPPDRPISAMFDAAHPGPTGDHFAKGSDKAPGAWFEYCNLGYGLVGTIIERVSGERFDRYMQRHILDPMKIAGGYNVHALSHPERLSTLYHRDAAGWTPETDDRTAGGDMAGGWPEGQLTHYRPGTNGTLFSPQGGLRISMPDLARVAQLLIGRGELDGVRILKPETVALMERTTWRYDGHNGTTGEGTAGPFNRYGMTIAWLTGWHDARGKGDLPYIGYRGGLRGHLGDAYALHSGLWYDPARKDAYVFAITGYPADESSERGDYSYFTRPEERVFTALSHAGGGDAGAAGHGSGGG